MGLVRGHLGALSCAPINEHDVYYVAFRAGPLRPGAPGCCRNGASSPCQRLQALSANERSLGDRVADSWLPTGTTGMDGTDAGAATFCQARSAAQNRVPMTAVKTMTTTSAHRVVRSSSFTAERAWGAVDIAEMNGITVRLHWTDQPYKWHTNDGQEVFAVMDGRVDMHVRTAKGVDVVELAEGDVFYAGVGCEHVAHPQGAARILVVETKGSV